MQLDKEIWARIGNSDQEAYTTVYIYYYRRLYNYGKKFTNNELLIEDTIQEVLMEIWKTRNRLSSVEFPVTYFYSSFRYLLFRNLRADQKIVNVEPEDEGVFSIDHFIIIGENDTLLKEKLNKSIAGLTSRQREAIFLRFYEGLSYQEVAEVMNITVKATYKIMARALQEMKDNLTLPLILLFLFQQLFY